LTPYNTNQITPARMMAPINNQRREIASPAILHEFHYLRGLGLLVLL
jgi:hypothetical protein